MGYIVGGGKHTSLMRMCTPRARRGSMGKQKEVRKPKWSRFTWVNENGQTITSKIKPLVKPKGRA